MSHYKHEVALYFLVKLCYYMETKEERKRKNDRDNRGNFNR